MQRKPMMLIVLDGWGHRHETKDNAIAAAKKPFWDDLWNHAPHTLISGCGLDVGLPDGQMGNSEVGHITLGSGRIVYQDLTRIDQAIKERSFFQNSVLQQTAQAVRSHQSRLHILGLLSPGGVHSHETHIHALLDFAKQQGLQEVYVHAFLDGRDTPPQSALLSLQALQKKMDALGVGSIASIMGRYYAMDRDRRYERTQQAYDCLTLGQTLFQGESAMEALEAAYEGGETDEFVQPTLIRPSPASLIRDHDAVVFANFRSDRARQLSYAFTQPNFNGFHRQSRPKLSQFVTMTEYAADLEAHVVFPKQSLPHGLGEYLQNHQKTQLRIAETEKYAHVTFFFNGGQEAPFVGEERILIPSPKVATYDQKPEMSAYEVTEALIAAIQSQRHDVIICNYANADMVGHTGNFNAAVHAVETLDQCLRHVCHALLKVGGEALITSDHGNVEIMFDELNHQPHTAHTTQWVPLIYVGARSLTLAKEGGLRDVAPSLLTLMDLPIPSEMTGRSLITFSKSSK